MDGRYVIVVKRVTNALLHLAGWCAGMTVHRTAGGMGGASFDIDPLDGDTVEAYTSRRIAWREVRKRSVCSRGVEFDVREFKEPKAKKTEKDE